MVDRQRMEKGGSNYELWLELESSENPPSVSIPWLFSFFFFTVPYYNSLKDFLLMPILCLYVSRLEVDRFQAQVLFPKAEAKAQPVCVLLPKVKLVHNIHFPRHLLMGIDWAFFSSFYYACFISRWNVRLFIIQFQELNLYVSRCFLRPVCFLRLILRTNMP